MAVHTIHIFDRKGKTLFTKRYSPSSTIGGNSEKDSNNDSEQLSEQRKLVFGMVYSLREITKMLAPAQPTNATDTGLHSVRTGASTLHTYETNSGLRLCIYVTNHNIPSGVNSVGEPLTTSDKILPPPQPVVVNGKVVRAALQHIYHELWIQCVTRSPMYTPTAPNVMETNFESKLDSYLKSQSWFV
jgi:trafficking protein particle complex subunit 1